MMDVKIDTDQECDLRNLVYTDDFGSNLRLEELVLLFGMENSEYEPEQFPALDYRPPDTGGLFKIFRTGKITLTGVTDPTEAEHAFESLFDTLDQAIESD
jgi:transcription initiation factor TFIID TATA-box-binding protein